MDVKTLHMLWLVPVFTITAQGLLDLSVSPEITAKCDSMVRLQCKASSSSQDELFIKHMGWYHRKTQLCFVDNHTNNLFNQTDHYCEYEDGQLTLIFPKLKPYQEGNISEPYLCKLRSNQGVKSEHTRVELDDCAGNVHGVLTTNGPSCTFYHVHPDGEVHWFNGSNKLWVEPSKSQKFTTKQVEAGGWLTIQSNLTLKEGSSGVVYNCSLKSSKSGKYIASTVVQKKGHERGSRAHSYSEINNSAVRSQEAFTNTVYVSVVFTVLKIIR